MKDHLLADPYASVQRRSNDHALFLLPGLRRRLSASSDPLRRADLRPPRPGADPPR